MYSICENNPKDKRYFVTEIEIGMDIPNWLFAELDIVMSLSENGIRGMLCEYEKGLPHRYGSG